MMNTATEAATILITEDLSRSILITVILAPVAAAIFSFLGTFAINYFSQRNYKKKSRLDYIDTLLLQLNELIQALDRLREDAEKAGIFFLTNTQFAKAIINKLRSRVESVLLLSEEGLKRKIVEIIDNCGSLIEEIDLFERYPLAEKGKLEQKIKERSSELKNLKLQLFNLGIYLDPTDHKPKYFEENIDKNAKKEGAEKKKLDIVVKMFSDIIDVKKDEEELKILNERNEKKRSYFVIRILDIQTKIRELVSSLNEARK